MKVKKFLIMIPAFNEAENIGKVLDNLKGYDVLVVNDASLDNTRNIVESKGFKCNSYAFTWFQNQRSAGHDA